MTSNLVPILAGISAALVGLFVISLPTILVARGHLSVFEAAKQSATLMHVTPECGGCNSALADYRSDASLRSVVIPVTAGPREGEAPEAYDVEICELALAGLRERGEWWVRWVERPTACRSLWAGEREFQRAHPVVAWPQFSRGDAMISSLDDSALHAVGVERLPGHQGYRGVMP